jgi:hypothetical protein
MSKKSKTAAERRYHDRVAAMGCVVCRNLGYGATPASVHHIRAGQGLSQRAGEYLVLPLCPEHHQHGGHGVAIHAGQEAWERIYGTETDLLDQVIGEIAA